MNINIKCKKCDKEILEELSLNGICLTCLNPKTPTFYEEFHIQGTNWDPKDFCQDGVLSITHDGHMRCGHVHDPDYLECKRDQCISWCHKSKKTLTDWLK